MGFDRILAAADLGYRGLPFNWVTMPDQFTLAAFDRLVRLDAAREGRRRASVLGVEGSGWDVGMAARFLLSAQARFVTGQVLVVDGGATLVGPSRESEG